MNDYIELSQLVSLDDLKRDYARYIEVAKNKRDRINEFNIVKRL